MSSLALKVRQGWRVATLKLGTSPHEHRTCIAWRGEHGNEEHGVSIGFLGTVCLSALESE